MVPLQCPIRLKCELPVLGNELHQSVTRMAMPIDDREDTQRDHRFDRLQIEADPAHGGRPDMSTLSPAAAETIRLFIADCTVKGGASPADIADLYVRPEVLADARATLYLDRRFVYDEMPRDWRELQDQLSEVSLDLAVGAKGAELLARLGQFQSRGARSIFDDPDDLDSEESDRTSRFEHASPSLVDLDDQGRRAIERQIVADVMHYGLPAAFMMQLREDLFAAGDARSLQYLDLPFEAGTLPADWEELKNYASRVRSTLEARGHSPGELFSRLEASRPDLDLRAVLAMIEDGTA
jgi:hypothetical protein